MPIETQRNKPSARCFRCGHSVEAEDWADVHADYTAHVVNEHNMAGHARQLDESVTLAVDDA